MPKGDTTSVKVSNTGPRKYKTVKTPEKIAADKAAGGNSNVGKVVTYTSGTTVDYTQVNPRTAASIAAQKKNMAEKRAARAANKVK